jgi:hypothetical protein
MCGLDGPVVGFCEQSNESSGFIASFLHGMFATVTVTLIFILIKVASNMCSII